MSVTPLACSVAAVVMMMNRAMTERRTPRPVEEDDEDSAWRFVARVPFHEKETRVFKDGKEIKEHVSVLVETLRLMEQLSLAEEVSFLSPSPSEPEPSGSSASAQWLDDWPLNDNWRRFLERRGIAICND